MLNSSFSIATHPRRANLDTLKHSQHLRYVPTVLFFAGTICVLGLMVASSRIAAKLRDLDVPPPAGTRIVPAPEVLGVLNIQSPNDDSLIAELPTAAPTDAQFRFAAKIAQEQGVEIAQMQSQALKSDPEKLGQSHLTLQLRGDYRAIKNVWIALLAKYPGLTSQRLSLRHHAETSLPTLQQPTVDRSDDEAVFELIQYTRPVVPSR